MKIAISRVTALALILTVGLAPPAQATSPSSAGRQSSPGDAAAAQLEDLGGAHARALADAMRAGDWDRRRAPQAGPFQAAGALQPLLLALQDERPVVRRLALWGISELRAREAGTAVVSFLADSSPQVRGEAARALGDLGATGEALRIVALLRDPDGAVRVQAAHALGDLQHPGTRPALEAACDDSNARVRVKARWALARVADAERILRRHGGRH